MSKKIVGCQSRCGKTIKQQMFEEIWERLSEHEYKYYYPSNNLLEEALEQERRYQLNCSDFEKDLSPEAVNRRIINYIKRHKD